MLIGNYSVFNKSPSRFRAGTSTCDRYAYNLPGMSRGIYFADRSVYVDGSSVTISSHPLTTYGIPLGEVPPYSWIIPQVAGGMAMRTTGDSSLSFTLIPQQPTSVDFTGSSTLTAEASLLVAMLCAMTGGATLTASISGDGNMTSSMTGSGSLSADITAFGNMLIDLVGSGILNGGVTATADMSIDIVVTGTGLTTENVGAAIWNSVASEFDNAGTMGEIMNNMGAVADPWSTLLPGSYTDGQAGKILGDLLSNIPDSVWNELKTTHTTADSYGKMVSDIEKLAKQIKALTAAGL